MFTDSLSREEWRLSAVSAIVLGGMAIAVALGEPGHASFLPPCPLHFFTGWFCPGCGSTRALWYLVHGHLLLAARENLLAATVLPFVLYDLAAVLTRRWQTLSSRMKPWSVWALLAAVLLFTVLRNIPLAPFTALAPTAIR